MNTMIQKPIGQIVAEDYRTAHIFRTYGLDFCCGGKFSLEESCAEKNIDVNKLTDEILSLKESGDGGHNYNEWSLDFLIDYIVNNHHSFVRTKLPEINFYAEKVTRVHGGHHPELHDILQNVRELSEEMLHHIQEEEDELFQLIKELVQNNKKGAVKSAIVEAMEEDHDKAGGIMEKIEELSDGFTPPADACSSYKVLFQSLEGFQIDLHKHVHLENNILFPKALELESRLN